ncbi:alpha/beta fold hydrolase [Spirochaeta cellobiosiphila]|uniref:alpha/beta fold hydrolase n=1 Tax=Spirochaeta cellobiosiphila TaxID=504483 RepID=UPI0003F58B7F|nr:alpha/beta fold hydrolase [Spirochaeta cellobiosiphila]
MLLNYKTYGEGLPLLAMHGLMGDKDNLAFLKNAFDGQYQKILIDQRNHGDSFHTYNMNYSIMAEDLFNIADHLEHDSVYLIGHSMGGKAVMEAALQHPDRVEKLIVLDMVPFAFPYRYVDYMEAMLKAHEKSFMTKEELKDFLLNELHEKAPFPFLAKNFSRKPPYRCRMGLKELLANVDHIFEELPKGRTYSGETIFIYGRNSFMMQYLDEEKIKEYFPMASFHYVDSGHLVHLDKKEEVLSLLGDFLL